MAVCQTWIEAMEQKRYDETLSELYSTGKSSSGLDTARERMVRVLKGFATEFDPDGIRDVMLFSAPGRTEIGGNHTDHQHGCVLCASVNLDMLACAAPGESLVIRIHPEGYPDIEVDLGSLHPDQSEQNTSAALVRGIAAKITQLGFSVRGFDAYVASDVPVGSGMSSSAAFEVLIGTIINQFFCSGTLDEIELAKIGQFAENVYFGKPCGLMDQMASSVGGVVAIDFTDPVQPMVQKVHYDFSASGYALCIVDTGSCHADLTDDYADITREMNTVANFFGKSVLRDVSEDDFCAAISTLREECGDRAVLRAVHFYEENTRAKEEAQALERGDLNGFLSLVNTSGISSALHLQNTWSISNPKQQAIPVALAIGQKLLNGCGAIRVHGGGFAGTIQAFVPNEMLDEFKFGMEDLLGTAKCHVLNIRPYGGCTLFK